MMVLSSLRPDASLVDFLESHARSESTRELVARTVVALALVLGALVPVSRGRTVVVTVAVAYFSYAMWGLLDRARSQSAASGRARIERYLRLSCAFFMVLGVASGIGLIFAIAFSLLGAPWIL